jgi:hypothetical protein
MFQCSQHTTIGATTIHHGIAAILKMEACAAQQSTHERDEGRTTDMQLLLFGDFFSPGAGPRQKQLCD